MPGPDDYVVVGEVVKARGLNGEVVVKSLSDVEGRFETLTGAYLRATDRERTWFEVESVRRHRDMYLIKFQTINDRLGARDRLVGCTVEIAREQSPPSGADEDYYYELIGLRVFRSDGPEIGVLEGIIETGANDVYQIRGTDGQEYLVPATREVVETVDVAGGRMIIRPLPGLLEQDV